MPVSLFSAFPALFFDIFQSIWSRHGKFWNGRKWRKFTLRHTAKKPSDLGNARNELQQRRVERCSSREDPENGATGPREKLLEARKGLFLFSCSFLERISEFARQVYGNVLKFAGVDDDTWHTFYSGSLTCVLERPLTRSKLIPKRPVCVGIFLEQETCW